MRAKRAIDHNKTAGGWVPVFAKTWGCTLTTIKMICHKLSFPEGIELYGLSDLHIGSPEFDEGAFTAATREILSKDNRFVILDGDIVDNGVKSSVTSPYEAVMQPRAQREYAAELLNPLRDRILGAVGGNHEYRSAKDSDFDPAENILSRIGREDVYRETQAYLLINLGTRSNGHLSRPIYSVLLTHGSSGGATLGAGLTKADQFASICGADLMIVGHSHKPGVAPASRFICNKHDGTVNHQNYGIMVCTAWLTYGGYPTRKALRPLPIAMNHAELDGGGFGFRVIQPIA